METHKKKGMLALWLALCLVLGLGMTAYAAPQELIVSMTSDIETTEWFQEALYRFTEKYPDVEVVLEPHEGISARSKFVSAVYANNAPDVLLANLYWVKDFALNGWISPLDDYFTEEEIADFYPDFVRYATVDDKLYGLFNGTDVATVIYRKSMLADAGVEMPALQEAMTWDEFFDAAQKATLDTNGDGATDVWGGGIIGQ